MPPRFISARWLALRQNLSVTGPGIAGTRHWGLPAGGGHDHGHAYAVVAWHATPQQISNVTPT